MLLAAAARAPGERARRFQLRQQRPVRASSRRLAGVLAALALLVSVPTQEQIQDALARKHQWKVGAPLAFFSPPQPYAGPPKDSGPLTLQEALDGGGAPTSPIDRTQPNVSLESADDVSESTSEQSVINQSAGFANVSETELLDAQVIKVFNSSLLCEVFHPDNVTSMIGTLPFSYAAVLSQNVADEFKPHQEIKVRVHQLIRNKLTVTQRPPTLSLTPLISTRRKKHWLNASVLQDRGYGVMLQTQVNGTSYLGLMHRSQVKRGFKFQQGQDVEVYIINISSGRRGRIAFSMLDDKGTKPQPIESTAQKKPAPAALTLQKDVAWDPQAWCQQLGLPLALAQRLRDEDVWQLSDLRALPKKDLIALAIECELRLGPKGRFLGALLSEQSM